jgi:hypothetical protein
MRRAANRYRSLLLLAAVALAIPGCELMPDPAFDALPEALTLKIVGAKLNSSRSSIDFSFELANRGSSTARACLGPSRSLHYDVDYEGGSLGGVAFDGVDHPGCTRQFAIESGGTLSWAETLEIRDLRRGRLEVKVDLQITNPNRCGSWGNCSAFDVTSNPFEIR